MALRNDFPVEGNNYLGGTSDGFVYRSVFAGSSLAHTYDMVRQFLAEEGYADVPLPKDVEELSKFYLPAPSRQLRLFEDNGYVHNPIKILFPNDGRRKKTLLLEIYNEKAPNHLLRFHGKI